MNHSRADGLLSLSRWGRGIRGGRWWADNEVVAYRWWRRAAYEFGFLGGRDSMAEGVLPRREVGCCGRR
jgi:hypothetical protein